MVGLIIQTMVSNIILLKKIIHYIKAVSILTGRDTDFRKWSVEWPTNVWQRFFANL
jgi:hypothetical protein